MIGRLVRDVRTAMLARKFPHPVAYGPERAGQLVPVGSGTRIVVQHDRTGNDAFALPRGGGRRVDKVRQTREVAAEAYVFAESPLEGATVEDHEALAAAMLDLFVIELVKWGTNASLSIVGGRFLRAEEISQAGIEAWSGVVYRLAFTVRRAILDRDYLNVGATTGGPLGQPTTETVINGETACE